MNLKARLQWWCKVNLRFHIIKLDDMAFGKSDHSGVPLTGFRWHCVLCGRVFDIPTQSGLDQIANGVPQGKALQWMNEGHKE